MTIAINFNMENLDANQPIQGIFISDASNCSLPRLSSLRFIIGIEDILDIPIQ